MRVLFFHLNGIDGNFGGVSRTTETLGKIFEENGVEVWFVGARNISKQKQYHPHQLFLPNEEKIDSGENLDYLCNVVIIKDVHCIINQASLNHESVNFIARVKERTGVKIFSCLHNSVLTPAINGAYQKEYLLRKKHLKFVFNVMRTPIVSKLMVKTYIRKYRTFYQNIIDKSDKVVLLCNGLKEELRKMCGTLNEEKIAVVPNCQIPVKDARPFSEKNKVVLWVGTMDYSIKRPDNMLRIWSMVQDKFPDWKLKLVGDGPSKDEVEKMSEQMKLHNVSFEGRRSPVQYYREANIVCVTSVHESFSLVTTEAQANGAVPVVFDSFPAASLVVEDGSNGILVPAFDLDQYAKSLDELMSDDKRMKVMGERAKEMVSRFSPERVYGLWNKELSK